MLLYILVVVGLYMVYEVGRFAYNIHIARGLSEVAVRFEKLDENMKESGVEGGIHLLVLGDSTAVGVGSTASESVPAYLAEYLGATHVENYAVSGARTSDLARQRSMAKRSKYDMVLIQIGANDIIRFVDLDEAIKRIVATVSDLKKQSKEVYVLTAGDIGASALFPWFARPIYHARTMEYHKKVEGAIASVGGVYVNLYESPQKDVFVLDPDRYFAKDGLHPSALGYKEWFTKVVTSMESLKQ